MDECEARRRERAHESDSGSSFGIGREPARECRNALLTKRAGAAKNAAKAAQEIMARGAPPGRSARSAADPKHPLRFMKRQTSGFHCLQTCSACADNKPE